MDCTRENGIGLFFSYQIHYFCLILPVVSKLLSQWNAILQNQQKYNVLGRESSNIRTLYYIREFWILFLTYNWAVVSDKPEAADAKLTPVKSLFPCASWLR